MVIRLVSRRLMSTQPHQAASAPIVCRPTGVTRAQSHYHGTTFLRLVPHRSRVVWRNASTTGLSICTETRRRRHRHQICQVSQARARARPTPLIRQIAAVQVQA